MRSPYRSICQDIGWLSGILCGICMKFRVEAHHRKLSITRFGFVNSGSVTVVHSLGHTRTFVVLPTKKLRYASV
jgi:hypothetical protein